jgi:hypothetical protein
VRARGEYDNIRSKTQRHVFTISWVDRVGGLVNNTLKRRKKICVSKGKGKERGEKAADTRGEENANVTARGGR